ncbi:hypothetical protein D9M71_444620 [compost metagenome]
MMKTSRASGCTRPSKLRLPDVAATVSSLRARISSSISLLSRGPDMPLQVVQP